MVEAYPHRAEIPSLKKTVAVKTPVIMEKTPPFSNEQGLTIKCIYTPSHQVPPALHPLSPSKWRSSRALICD
jgi:hypothetical protein